MREWLRALRELPEVGRRSPCRLGPRAPLARVEEQVGVVASCWRPAMPSSAALKLALRIAARGGELEHLTTPAHGSSSRSSSATTVSRAPSRAPRPRVLAAEKPDLLGFALADLGREQGGSVAAVEASTWGRSGRSARCRRRSRGRTPLQHLPPRWRNRPPSRRSAWACGASAREGRSRGSADLSAARHVAAVAAHALVTAEQRRAASR